MSEPNKPDQDAQLPPWAIDAAWKIIDALGYPYNRDDRPEVADWHRSDMAQLLARIIAEAASRTAGEGQAQDADRIRFALAQAQEDATGCECLAVDLKHARIEDIATAKSALTRLAASSTPVEDERCPTCHHKRRFFNEVEGACMCPLPADDVDTLCLHRCDFSRPTPEEIKVQTSPSGRRFVDVEAVIRNRLARAKDSRPPATPPDGSLTPRQLEIASLVAESRGIDLETAQELVYLRDRVATLPTAPDEPLDAEIVEAQRLFELTTDCIWRRYNDNHDKPSSLIACDVVNSSGCVIADSIENVADANWIAAAHNLWLRLVARAQAADAVWDEAIQIAKEARILPGFGSASGGAMQTVIVKILETARGAQKGEKHG